MIRDPRAVERRLERITGANEADSRLAVSVFVQGKFWHIASRRDGNAFLNLRGYDPQKLVTRFVNLNLAAILQDKIQEQDGYCALCGRRAGGMDPDHIVARSKERDDRPQNVRALCRKCHDERHGEPQWRKTREFRASAEVLV